MLDEAAIRAEFEGVQPITHRYDRRQRQALFSALSAAVGYLPETASQKSYFGKVVNELLEVGATREEVLRRSANWPRLFPKATLTPSALTKWWSALE
jgi:hypothetical protein